MISANYVSIMVIYYLFIYNGIYGSNIQHSILYFINANNVLIYKEFQDNISNNYVRIFGNLQQFIQCSVSASLFTFGNFLYNKEKKIFLTFMLDFLPLYLCQFIFVGKERKPNIKFQLIPIARIFLFASSTNNYFRKLR